MNKGQIKTNDAQIPFELVSTQLKWVHMKYPKLSSVIQKKRKVFAQVINLHNKLSLNIIYSIWLMYCIYGILPRHFLSLTNDTNVLFFVI